MIIPSIVSNEELLQVIAKAVARVKEKATNFSAKVKASGNDPNVFKDLTAASRAGEISAIDKIRRDHYGNVPDEDLAGALMHKMIAYVRGELSEEEAAKLFGGLLNDVKVLKECAKAYGIHEMDKAVFNHLTPLVLGMLKMSGCDIEALESECDAMGYLWANATRDSPSPPHSGNEPPLVATVVEVDDAYVKKLAGATAMAVKKAIKHGRGSANVRFPEETKWQCQSIWERYKDNPEVKKCAHRRKVSHNDVFEYAKTELARLEPVPISTADKFKRVLGAISDKKYRNSPALSKRSRNSPVESKKNRDKKHQVVYLPHSDFLSVAPKDRHR